jgi:hypothetical protein
VTQGEEGTEDKTTLAQKDIRFARTVQRLQRSLISELEKIGIVHLHTLGFRGEDLIGFSLVLNNPSKIAEIQELEHWNQKFTVATAATEGFFSKRWVAENLFGMSEEELLRNRREMFHDRKYEAEANAVGEAAGEAASAMAGMGIDDPLGGGGGFEPGGDLPGAEELMPELPGEEGMGTPAGEAGSADETPLLATPGKRDDDLKWVNAKKRKQDRRKTTAPRIKSYMRQATPETVKGSSDRGKFAGKKPLDRLSIGVYTEEQSSYEEAQVLEEQKILKVSHDVQKLIENLEKTERKKDEPQ